MARIWCFSGSRLSSRGLARRWFVLPQLYYIMVKWRTPGGGPSPLLRSSLLPFPLSLKCSELPSPVFAPRLDIKDNKFKLGKIFTNNKVTKAAY